MIVVKTQSVKQIPVTAYYTGDNGTYCSVVPTTVSVDRINQMTDIVRAAGFEPHTPLNYHVTVIHSKNGVERDKQMKMWALMQADQVFEAKPKHVTHWAGHNGKGYIVLELESPALAEIHNFLKKKFDLETSFPDYKAHLTLVEDAYDKKDKDKTAVQQVVNHLNQLLGLDAPPLTFTGIRVEDLKDD